MCSKIDISFILMSSGTDVRSSISDNLPQIPLAKLLQSNTHSHSSSNGCTDGLRDVVLETSVSVSRPLLCGLGLGLERQGLSLGLASAGLGLGLDS